MEGSHKHWLLTDAWAWLCAHSPKTAPLDAKFGVFSRLMSEVLVVFYCIPKLAWVLKGE